MNRAVAEIPIGRVQVGDRQRRDLGDLSALVASLRDRGMLVPLTVADEYTLILGGRRLAAARDAGLATVPCWIVEGVSDRLSRLLAVRDAHRTRKELSPLEQARLYAELRELTTAEARARQAATRFGALPGAGDSPAPGDYGTAREKAARAVTGRGSYHQHEQVLTLQRLSEDDTQPPWLRTQAQQALEDIERRRKVHRPYLEVMTAHAVHTLQQATADETLPDDARVEAKAALQEVSNAAPTPRGLSKATRAIRHLNGGLADIDPLARGRLARERLLAVIDDAAAQLERVDIEQLRPVLTEADRELIRTFTHHVDMLADALLPPTAAAG